MGSGAMEQEQNPTVEDENRGRGPKHMGGSQNPWEGARSRGVESESMGQVWHPIGEDENPWCGVRMCRVGVRSHGTRAEQE